MDFSSIMSLTIELVLGFIMLLLVTQFLGKTQISQVTPFDFISALVLGELLGNAIYDKEVDIFFILYAIFLWTMLMYTIERVTQRFKGIRGVFEGRPSIVVRNGQIDYEQLKKEKIDINELLSLMRQNDVFSVREIEYAILEPSGSLSILKKSKYEVPTKNDLNIPEKRTYLSSSLILDGEILWDNLKECGFDQKWLENQLHMFGINKLEEVFYAEWKEDEGIHVVPLKIKKRQ